MYSLQHKIKYALDSLSHFFFGLCEEAKLLSRGGLELICSVSMGVFYDSVNVAKLPNWGFASTDRDLDSLSAT